MNMVSLVSVDMNSVVFNDNLKLLETIDTEKKVSLIKEINDSIYFVSWSKNYQGKIFKLINKEEINLNVYSDSLLIGDYFKENDGIKTSQKIFTSGMVSLKENIFFNFNIFCVPSK